MILVTKTSDQARQRGHTLSNYLYNSYLSVCVCSVCVFFPFILDIKFVGRTSRGHTGGRSHRISHPPFPSAVRALIFLATRIQPFLSLVDRELEFCVLVLHFCSFFFSLRENHTTSSLLLVSLHGD